MTELRTRRRELQIVLPSIAAFTQIPYGRLYCIDRGTEEPTDAEWAKIEEFFEVVEKYESNTAPSPKSDTSTASTCTAGRN